MPKTLFITHDISDYGAARSMQEVLVNAQGDFYLLVILPYFKGNPDKKIVSRKFNIPEERIFYKFGYTSDEYLGGPSGIKRYILQKIKKLLLNFQRNTVNRLISEYNIDHVYLNSLTLYPYVQKSKQCDYTIHVRERLLTKNKKSVFKAFEIVDKVIYIDQSTKQALNLPYNKKDIILTDPVDMRYVHTHETLAKCKKYLPDVDFQNKTVFSMIGKIDFWDKGTGFVLESFIDYQSDDYLLLVFGDALPWTKDLQKCYEIIGNNENIKLLGAVSDQSIIYGLSDVVVRGEESFAVGRTVLEGLRSGCSVIMPGDDSDLLGNNLEFAKDNILFYEGRNKAEFKSRIESLFKYKKSKVSPEIASTVDSYNKDFFEFLYH